ncbi:hypothetical protein KKF05_01010 [Patescibacteria group bacterium]|nr:hypothetical protein [Patescibacteria group bacterium]MBU1028958.1 hypothetical protein [Patescibacteria group bacterium]
MNQSFEVVVDYEAAWHQLTEGGRNAWAGQTLHQSVAADTQIGVRQRMFELVVYDEEVVGLDTLSLLLLADGLRLATATELRAFAEQYQPPVDETQSILALGAAFFNQPKEYPEEWGWFASQLKIFAEDVKCFWLVNVMPRGGRLKWPAGTIFLAVRI